jgi:hypothetical protein
VSKAYIELVRGRDGSQCLVLCDERNGGGLRIAGSKPLGGGTTIKDFAIDVDEVIAELQRIKELQP